jgi:predicted nuclease of predicted toxin-antitoxin system
LKLLVDENLAPRLATNLADLFPDSVHVSSVELSGTPDAVVWEYAKAHRFTFLTKDKDFASLSIIWGAPSKVVLLQTGNCSTTQIERIVRGNAIRFLDFEKRYQARPPYFEVALAALTLA